MTSSFHATVFAASATDPIEMSDALRSPKQSERSRMLQQAFTQLQPMVYATALSITGQRSDAEDVLQDVFVVLNARYEEIDPVTLRGWLKQTTKNVARNSVRKRGRHEQRGVGPSDSQATGDPAPLTTLAVRTIFERLSEEHRDVLWAKYALGCTLEEIAVKLEVSVATAGRRVQQALQCVRMLAGERSGEHELLGVLGGGQNCACRARPA